MSLFGRLRCIVRTALFSGVLSLYSVFAACPVPPAMGRLLDFCGKASGGGGEFSHFR